VVGHSGAEPRRGRPARHVITLLPLARHTVLTLNGLGWPSAMSVAAGRPGLLPDFAHLYVARPTAAPWTRFGTCPPGLARRVLCGGRGGRPLRRHLRRADTGALGLTDHATRVDGVKRGTLPSRFQRRAGPASPGPHSGPIHAGWWDRRSRGRSCKFRARGDLLPHRRCARGRG